MSFVTIIIGLILLVKGADLFVDGCSKAARRLGIPPLIVGLTIVALGTSAPEAAVSITATLKRMNDLSLGNIVGSNICNLLLVLGLSGLGENLRAKKKAMTRDFIWVISSALLLFIMSFSFFSDSSNVGVISRLDGYILLLFGVIYLYILIKDAKSENGKSLEKTDFKFSDLLCIIIGGLSIVFGGYTVVNSSIDIAYKLRVSQNVIALTIIAIGTSLPELVTSVVASFKKEDDIAIGNVVGSNIFNILFILGISSSINPIIFNFQSFIDIIIMILSSIMVYLMMLKDYRIGRKKSIILLSSYIIYLMYILIR